MFWLWLEISILETVIGTLFIFFIQFIVTLYLKLLTLSILNYLLPFNRYLSELKTVDSNYFIFLFLFVISFSFIFIFGDLGLGLTWHHCHTVTHLSHDRVTGTLSCITWKSIEGSKRMMLYSMILTYIDLKRNTWLFRVG